MLGLALNVSCGTYDSMVYRSFSIVLVVVSWVYSTDQQWPVCDAQMLSKLCLLPQYYSLLQPLFSRVFCTPVTSAPV